MAKEKERISLRRYYVHLDIIDALKERNGEGAERAARAPVANAFRDLMEVVSMRAVAQGPAKDLDS